MDITQKIKSFEDACKHLGISGETPKVDHLQESFQKSVVAGYKLQVVVKALNEGWVPDYNNYAEYKYYPWFEVIDNAGLASLYASYVSAYAATNIGARLCFKNNQLAQYAATQFKALYEEFLL